jgi:hypothetical protein
MARVLVLLIGTVALALLPASAVAKKQKKPVKLGPVVTATATGPVATVPAGSSDATATCPNGLQAVGGGFSAPFGSSGGMIVSSSYRSAPDSWQVSGTLVQGTGAATVYAYCRRNTLRISDFSATGTLPSGGGQSKLVEAECPAKAVAISGGYQMTTGPQPAHLPIPEASGLGSAPGSWQVIAQNSDTGEHTITAHAYCATGIRAPAVGQALGSATVPFLGSLSETSQCAGAPASKKKGTKRPAQLFSGGGFNSPFTVGIGVLPVHAESRIAGSGFVDTIVNGGSSAGPTGTLSQAICL